MNYECIGRIYAVADKVFGQEVGDASQWRKCQRAVILSGVMREMTRASYPEIARMFAPPCSHTTAISRVGQWSMVFTDDEREFWLEQFRAALLDKPIPIESALRPTRPASGERGER